MMQKACVSGSTGTRNHISERRRGSTGWLYTHSLLSAMVLVALLSALSGCGPEQTNVGQATGNSVPVSLSISMPQESAAASTSGSRFWATLQSWLPSIPSAWAQTPTAELVALTIEVTGPGLSSITDRKDLDDPVPGQVIEFELDVPIGPDRVFKVFGIDASNQTIRRGESIPITLIAGRAESVEVILTDNTIGAITGTVTNAGTGTPLPNATLAVRGTSLRTTTTSDGNFTLNGIPQGPQTLVISALGFTSTTRDVTVVAGSSISAGTIALMPLPITGAVTGTVTNASTGTPLPNATVRGTGFPTTTDNNGNFTLNGIRQGPQTLAISASGFTPTTRDVTVVAGSSISAGTIALVPLPITGAVTGTVTNAETGAPLFRATVTVNGTSLSTNSDGNFTHNGVLQGRQTLAISASGFTSTTRDVTITAGASVSAGTIALTPLPPTTGRVTGIVTNATNGSPIPSASVRIVNTNLQTSTDTNGSFTLNDVLRGPQTVEATATRFTSNSVPMNVVGGQTQTVSISLSPLVPPSDRIRIILNWGPTPRDLDAHLMVPSNPPFEIFFGNKGTLTAPPFAILDTDEQTGLGPETITISTPSAQPPPRFPGTYCYFVRKFSQDGLLTSSGASIQVLNGNTEIARFTVPTIGTGLNWEVFTLDGTTGAITPVAGDNGRITDTACQ